MSRYSLLPVVLGLAPAFAFTTVHAQLPITKVSEIQGLRNPLPPLLGQTVRIKVIVTQTQSDDAGLEAFFAQEEADDHDADPDTSEGILVYTPPGTTLPGPPLVAGDVVEVVGTVDANFGGGDQVVADSVAHCGTVPPPNPHRGRSSPARGGGAFRFLG